MSNDTHRGGRGLASGEEDGLGATIAALSAQVSSVLPKVTRVVDSNYSILPSDRTVSLKSTTSSGDHTITFGPGLDGQEVTVVVEVLSGSDNFVIAGLDSGAITLTATNHSVTAAYNLTDDSWRLISKTVHIQTRSTEDTTGSVFGSDRVINVSTTTSGGDYTLTFNASTDGALVSVVMTGKSGTDEYILAGLETSIRLRNVKDSVLVQYNLATDKWYVISSSLSGVVRISNSDYTVLSGDTEIFLDSTTSAGAYDLTFGTGVDGQKVTVQLQLKTGTDGYQLVGIEDINAFADYMREVGDSISVVYDATDDVWRVTSMMISGIRTLSDGNGTVLKNDRTVYVNTTLSTGNYTLTFGSGEKNQRVTVIMTGRDGSDDVVLAGLEDAVTLIAVNQVCSVIYNKTIDKWFVVSQQA